MSEDNPNLLKDYYKKFMLGTYDMSEELDKIYVLPTHVRKISDKPLEGYAPSFRFEDMWEESDSMFRERIMKEMEDGKTSNRNK